MITENGSVAKVFEIDDTGNKIKFTTVNGDGIVSAWFSVFDGVGIPPKIGDFIKIKKFTFESVPNIKNMRKEFPVTLRVTLWEVLDIPS